MAFFATASQTVGPFFAIGMARGYRADLAAGVPGEKIVVAGQVLDGDGQPVVDGCLEFWQADAEGRYAHPEDPRRPAEPGFRGFARLPTDARGGFLLATIKPGPVRTPGAAAAMASHLVVSVFARGVLRRLLTRMYFPGDPAHADDPVLALVPAERRGTLIGRAAGNGNLEWNVILQGNGETVFFDC